MVKYPDAAAAAATLGNWRPLNVAVARETRAEEERRNHLRGGTVYRFRLILSVGLAACKTIGSNCHRREVQCQLMDTAMAAYHFLLLRLQTFAGRR